MLTPRNSRRSVFLFAGQGSQYYHMGQELFAERAGFYRHAQELDGLLRAHLGESILATIYDPRARAADVFQDTVLSYAAIFLVEYALGSALLSEGLRPDYMLATSMGTFAALALAGCMTVEQAIRALTVQADLIDRLTPPGGMLALPALSEPLRLQGLELARQYGCEIGMHGKHSSCAVSADLPRVEATELALRRAGIAFQRLPVRRAFHSRWIDAAQAPYIEFLQTLSLQPARIPVICCTTGQQLEAIPRNYSWDVVRLPILFEEAVGRLAARTPLRCIDLSPSGTLATSLKYCLPQPQSPHQVQSVLTPYGGARERYLKLFTPLDTS